MTFNSLEPRHQPSSQAFLPFLYRGKKPWKRGCQDRIIALAEVDLAKYTYLSLVFPCLLLHWTFVFILKIQELRCIGVCNGLVT